MSSARSPASSATRRALEASVASSAASRRPITVDRSGSSHTRRISSGSMRTRLFRRSHSCRARTRTPLTRPNAAAISCSTYACAAASWTRRLTADSMRLIVLGECLPVSASSALGGAQLVLRRKHSPAGALRQLGLCWLVHRHSMPARDLGCHHGLLSSSRPPNANFGASTCLTRRRHGGG